MQLRGAAAGGFALLIVGLLIAFYFRAEHKTAIRQNAQAQAANRQAQANLDVAYAERRDISEFLPRYGAYQRLGALDEERRLEWMERLAVIRDERRLPRMSYTIAPRAPYPQLANPSQTLSFQASRMRLDMGLLHEGDFVQMLERLRAPPVGTLEIQNCRLRRNQESGAPAADAAAGNLSATCEVDWISLLETRPPATDGTPAAQSRARAQ